MLLHCCGEVWPHLWNNYSFHCKFYYDVAPIGHQHPMWHKGMSNKMQNIFRVLLFVFFTWWCNRHLFGNLFFKDWQQCQLAKEKPLLARSSTLGLLLNLVGWLIRIVWKHYVEEVWWRIVIKNLRESSRQNWGKLSTFLKVWMCVIIFSAKDVP
jgi:hypothetical protein